jgi:mRNA interferase RelE/StbE
MLKLDLTNDVASSILGLEAKQARQVWNKIVALMKDPRPSDSISIGEGFYRTSIGEYRIIYSFDKQCLYIAIIGKRNDDEVYRKFKNKR